jgi:hypothetical protein
MNRIAIAAVAAALFGGTNAAEAQRMVAARDVPPGLRPPAGMCRVWIEGVAPGRQPRVTDCATARATAPLNSRIIVGDQTPFPGRGRGRVAQNCDRTRTNGSLGDIIFGSRVPERALDCRRDDRDRRVARAEERYQRDLRKARERYERSIRRADNRRVADRRGRRGDD